MDYSVAYPLKTAFDKHQETCVQCASLGARLGPQAAELLWQSLSERFEVLDRKPGGDKAQPDEGPAPKQTLL